MTMFTFKKWALPLAAAVALCVAGCGDKGTGASAPNNNTPETWEPISGTFTDERDSTVYKTVKLNKTTWMAENLNYAPDSGISDCYDNKPENCAIYGRLYHWTTAMEISYIYDFSTWGGSDVGHQGICPAGWHLPSKREWDNLFNTVGGDSTAGRKLKSTTGWSNNGNGTDDYGFTALPGGDGCDYGCFAFIGEYATWWTATEDIDSDYAFRISMHYMYDGAGGSKHVKILQHSVRCVQNN